MTHLVTISVFLAYWSIRITLLGIYTLQLVRKINYVYYCV